MSMPDLAAARAALELGLFPISVHCDEPGNQPGTSGVTFWAFVKTLPRIGERLVLEDRSTCEVRQVLHQMHRDDENPKLIMFGPVVLAELIGEHGEIVGD